MAEHGGNYVAGDRVTIADFIVFSLYSAFVSNDFSENEQATDIYNALKFVVSCSNNVGRYLSVMQREVALLHTCQHPNVLKFSGLSNADD